MSSCEFIDSQVLLPRDTIARFLDCCVEHRVDFKQNGVSGHVTWRLWGNDGPPVILLHGGTGSWLHWIRNFSALSEHYRVFAVDIPGMGDSSMPGILEPVQDLMRGLADLIGASWEDIAEGSDRAHIVGFSFGSMVGAHTALRMGRIASLTLVGTSALQLPFPGSATLLKPKPQMSKSDLREMHRYNMLEIMFCKPRNADELALEMQLRNAERMRIQTHTSARTDILVEALPMLPLAPTAIWGSEGQVHPRYRCRNCSDSSLSARSEASHDPWRWPLGGV
jgi:pimeloyl-ACP methyl ester carboxylesterase